MHDRVGILSRDARVSNDMNHRNKFSVVTGHTTVSRKLSRSKCRHECCSAFHTGIAISSVRRDEFVRISLPIQTVISDEIEKCKFVVLVIISDDGFPHP